MVTSTTLMTVLSLMVLISELGPTLGYKIGGMRAHMRCNDLEGSVACFCNELKPSKDLGFACRKSLSNSRKRRGRSISPADLEADLDSEAGTADTEVVVRQKRQAGFMYLIDECCDYTTDQRCDKRTVEKYC